MSDPKINTLQYREFLSQLNKALPLELTIRAVRLACPEKLEKLMGIDAEIRAAWKEHGFTEEEVDHNGLAELCWDFTQLGWSERRKPFERYPADVVETIRGGLPSICEEYLSQVRLEDYPFALRHRYADLVRGMDIYRVLRDYLERYKLLRSKPDLDGVRLSNFVLSFRSPVSVIPGARQQIRIDDGSKNSDYLGIMLRYDMPLKDVQAALLDFQHHYAEFRLKEHKLTDGDTHRLLDPWGDPAMPSREDLVIQSHQVHPRLAGLHCYDLFVAHGAEGTEGSRVRAIKDTIALHPEALAPDEVRAGKWLDGIRKTIKDLAKELKEPFCGSPLSFRKSLEGTPEDLVSISPQSPCSVAFGYADFCIEYLSNSLNMGLMETSSSTLPDPSEFSSRKPRHCCVLALHGHLIYSPDEQCIKESVEDGGAFAKTIATRMQLFMDTVALFNSAQERMKRSTGRVYKIVIDDGPVLDSFAGKSLEGTPLFNAAVQYEQDRKFSKLGQSERINHFAQEYGFTTFEKLRDFLGLLDAEAQSMGYPSYEAIYYPNRYLDHLQHQLANEEGMQPTIAALTEKRDVLQKQTVFTIERFVACRRATQNFFVDVTSEGVLITLREGRFTITGPITGIVSSEHMSG